MYNLWTGGYYQNACEASGMFANPANVTIYTTKPFNLLVPGDNVFGINLVNMLVILGVIILVIIFVICLVTDSVTSLVMIG